jgi:addiction module RelE/StbE family toxin
MRVRFTRPALADLNAIYAYVSERNPSAAARLVARLIDRALALADSPYQGRKIDEANGRVVVIPRYRYFIFYAIENDEIHIAPIRHTSRRRPWDER